MRSPWLALPLVFLLFYCDRERQDRPGETVMTTGATLELVPAPLAQDRVIAAQCMREQLCVEVGLATEDTSTSCADRARSARCKSNVDPGLLEECLDAIYNSSCAIGFEARGRLEPCERRVLCRAP